MGFAVSLKRRYRLVQGEPFHRAISLFFGSRKTRRAVETQKFGPVLEEHSSPLSLAPNGVDAAQQARIAAILDEDWYRERHALAVGDDAMLHFCEQGLVKAYAPCPEMAAKDGLSLTHWAVEILIRNGIKVGPSGQDLQAIDQPGLLDPLSLSNPSGKKIAVVTAIFGGYDKLMPVHKAWTEHADFFLFSDQVFETGPVWQQVYANFFHTDPTRRARFVKLHLPTYFTEYDAVLWVDGNVLICDDPKKILEDVAFEDHDFATFSHPQRSSLIAETGACLRLKKDEPRILARHMKQVQDHPAFRGTQLYETMVLALRPNAPAVREMCSAWWRMMSHGSRRDQLSLPLAISEVDSLRVGLLPDNIETTPYFAKIMH